MPRQLPSAPEAEASLLGTMLVYPASTRIAMEEGLNEDDFFVIQGQEIHTGFDDFDMAFQNSYECLLDRGSNNAKEAKLPFYDEIQLISR